ncbi:HIT domain-containing protein [Halomonas llamarensis]|uniref:HIT family protein n=1 Tax=Halomonas llamarensis TaxID=2945104 RepID=A0ABT0SL62_9GAMM|nr:HIT family protein [Halomonas llamarensis]MCL7928542.1 HIT family protein [Halomonas llamarensis]
MNDIALDERLEADTFPVTELPLCRVLLMDDTRFTWVVLVPCQPNVSEVFELALDDQAQLWREAGALAKALKAGFDGDKMNIATLGNVVSQLHIHIIVRHHDDAAWPGPVWGVGKSIAYDLEQQGETRERLLALIEGLDLEPESHA